MRKKIAFFFFLFAAQLCFAILIFNSSLPKTAIDIPFAITKLFNATIKEGWAFFTKNPREPMVDVYTSKDNTYNSFIPPNGDVRNFFGLSRKSRELGFEVSILNPLIKSAEWRNYRGLDSAFRLSNTVVIKRPVLVKYLPSSFVIVQSTRIPWAWANYSNKVNITYTAVKIILK